MAIVCAQAAFAADAYYDTDPSTSEIDGGTGDWNDPYWKTAEGVSGGSTWTADDDAYFASSDPTTITLNSAYSAGSLTFNGSGYTLTGGTISLAGTEASNWFNMNDDATIESSLGHMRFRGAGETTISGGGTISARGVIGDGLNQLTTVKQTAGDYSIIDEYFMIGGNDVADSKGEYIIDSGTLTVGSGIYFGWRHSSSTGTFTQNGGTVETQANDQGLQLGIEGGTGHYNLNGGILWLGNNTAGGSVAGDIVIESGAGLNPDHNVSNTLANQISGAGALAIGVSARDRAEDMTYTISGNNSYSGGTKIYNKVIAKVANANAFGSGEVDILSDYDNSQYVGDAGALDLNGYTIENDIVVGSSGGDTGRIRNSNASTAGVINGDVTISGENYIGGGGGAFAINGVVSGGVTDGSYGLLMTDGKLTLANPNNTYDGFTRVSGGSTIEVTKLANQGEVSSVGQSSVAGANKISFAFDNGGTLRYIGSSASTSDRVMELGTGSNIIEADGATSADTLKLTSDMSGAGAVTLGGANAGDNEISGAIGSTSSLTKTGAGKWILSGANTYSGATSVDGGTLAVDGSLASAVTVANGATLSGAGALNGGVTVNSGGTLSPGASPGTMSITGDLTLDGVDLAVDIWGSTAETEYDVIDISTGSLLLTGDPTTITVDLGSDFDPNLGESFTIVTGGGSEWQVEDWGSISVENAPSNWTDAGKDFRVDQGSVMLTVIPEPGTGMLVIAAFGIVYLRRKLRG